MSIRSFFISAIAHTANTTVTLATSAIPEAKRFYADTVSATQQLRHSATPPAVTQSAPDDLAILDSITF